MKTIGSFMSALSAVFLGAADACASLSDGRLSSVTSLIDTSQNQAFESQPPAQGLLTADLEPVHSFKLASVQFITGGGDLTFNTPEFPDTSTDNCKRFGYTLTSCSAGNPALFCPYNDKYFKECCDSRYQYDKKDCAYPSTVSGDSCGGKFMCYCDRSLYPAYYTSGSGCSSTSTTKGKPYCTASFATDKNNGGASTPSVKTYKVGDTYSVNGVAMGKVVEVDSTGQHGVLAVFMGQADAATANATCTAKTNGGLNWGLATGRHACAIGGSTSCFDCSLHTSGGSAYCSGGNISSTCGSGCTASTVAGYVCEAPF